MTLVHFWAGETSADVAGGAVGMYMSGFFPCMMFGIPGAALAMAIITVQNRTKKKVAIGLDGFRSYLCIYLWCN